MSPRDAPCDITNRCMGLARTSAERAPAGRRRAAAACLGLLLSLAAEPGGSRFEASPLLADVGPGAWSERLAHPDPDVRRRAAWMLGRHAPAYRAARSLASSVAARLYESARRERDVGVVLAIVYACGRIDAPECDAALREMAGSESAYPPSARAAALRSLAARGGDMRAFAPSMLRLTASGVMPAPGDDTAEVAVRTLAELPHDAFARAVAEARDRSQGVASTLRAIGRRGDLRWARALLDALRPVPDGHSSGLALAALEAVSRLRCVEAADAVVALARSGSDLALRRGAVRALASLGGAFDASIVRGLLAEPALRDAALDTLGALGDREAAPAIEALLAAPWAGDRRAAAEALGAIGLAAAVAPLAARARVEPDAGARRTMWRAAARIGGAPALAALRAVDDPLARWALAELLVADGSLRGPDGVSSRDASGALVAALSGAHVDLSTPSADADARVAAALALGHARADAMGRAAALEAALAREPDEAVRVALVLALGRIGRDDDAPAAARGVACEALLGIATRERGAGSLAPAVALSELGALRVAAARDLAAQVVASEPRDALTRRVALHAAGRLSARGARVAVERALVVDPDAGVRGAAAFALASMSGAAAEGPLREASSLAWTGALVDRIEAARALARDGGGDGFTSAAVARAGSAPPRSVWCLTLPDGGLSFGVTTGDGELWIDGAPSYDDAELSRVR